MKLTQVILALCIAQFVNSQTASSNYIYGDQSKINLRFENVIDDSLKISHYVSGSENKISPVVLNFTEEYSFKVKKGEIHTVWITGKLIKKGFFFVEGTTPFEFDVILDLADPDIFRIHWDDSSQQYFSERIDYDVMEAAFPK